MLPTKFQVSSPFGSGEEAINRFSGWRQRRPSWISDQKDFSYFYESPQCFLPKFKSVGLSVKEKKQKIDYYNDGHGSRFKISDRNDFSYF